MSNTVCTYYLKALFPRYTIIARLRSLLQRINYFDQQGLPAQNEREIANDVITFCQKIFKNLWSEICIFVLLQIMDQILRKLVHFDRWPISSKAMYLDPKFSFKIYKCQLRNLGFTKKCNMEKKLHLSAIMTLSPLNFHGKRRFYFL